jgi:two-component system, chemotaxis family, sensor kinase Cph1
MSPQPDKREFAEFLLRVCHELRTPVRTIRSQAELLTRRAAATPGAAGEQGLDFIAGGTRSLDALVDGLASYSIALQTEAASFQPVRMDTLLRTVLAKLSQELRDREALVTFSELPRIRGDADRLMDAFEILLRNALVHRGQSAPIIEITAEEQGASWLFAVRDNGPGVDEPYRETIFRPFERLQGNRSGPGLGLAICRAIVERHGGRIWAEAQNGGGAAFLFTLPRD